MVTGLHLGATDEHVDDYIINSVFIRPRAQTRNRMAIVFLLKMAGSGHCLAGACAVGGARATVAGESAGEGAETLSIHEKRLQFDSFRRAKTNKFINSAYCRHRAVYLKTGVRRPWRGARTAVSI